MQWLKLILFPLPAFVAGAMSFYVWQLSQENQRLRDDMVQVSAMRGQLQEQQTLNARQREDFEGQVQQLQNNLLGAQTQMTNLSQALQEAREMIDPASAPATSIPATAELLPAAQPAATQ